MSMELEDLIMLAAASMYPHFAEIYTQRGLPLFPGGEAGPSAKSMAVSMAKEIREEVLHQKRLGRP